MKIVHVCICGPYTNGWSYQENILAKYHKKLGYEVTVITSKWVYQNSSKLVKKDVEIDYDNGIKVIRLDLFKDKALSYKFKRLVNFEKSLASEKPDIIFSHGVQFLDIDKIRNYVKSTNCVLYMDNHSDYTNSATNFFSKMILHKIIWRNHIRKIMPYVKKFYGVQPCRMSFLNEMYNIPLNKIDLLVMGGDDEELIKVKKIDKNKMKIKYHIDKDSIILITGGKIDIYKKEIIKLMKVISNFRNMTLLVFGSIENEIEDEFYEVLHNSNNIIYLGWIDSKTSYQYFELSDVAVFPGRHSVYWEQAVSQGKPLVVKRLNGIEHIDFNNVLYFDSDDTNEYLKKLKLLQNKEILENLKKNAISKKREDFYYSNIAKKSIEMY